VLEVMDSSLRFACVAICVAFSERGTHAQDPDDVRLRSERIVEDLASVYRYDSDLSVESGSWLSRFVHLRLGGSGKAREAIFLSFNPRLLSQVAEAAKSSSRESTAIEFQEYRFPIETCEGLSAEIAELQAALSMSVNSIGQRSSELNSQEIIVDGRHYGLNVRVNGYTVGQFRVGENERRLFEPLDAIVRTVEMCSKSASAQRRGYDF
jgi:hypothetical protein